MDQLLARHVKPRCFTGSTWGVMGQALCSLRSLKRTIMIMTFDQRKAVKYNHTAQYSICWNPAVQLGVRFRQFVGIFSGRLFYVHTAIIKFEFLIRQERSNSSCMIALQSSISHGRCWRCSPATSAGAAVCQAIGLATSAAVPRPGCGPTAGAESWVCLSAGAGV